MIDVPWIEPNRPTGELRGLKSYLQTGGAVYGRTTRSGQHLAVTFRNGPSPQKRALDAGIILTAPAAQPVGSLNPSEGEVLEEEHVYIPGDGVGRPSIPTIQEYYDAAEPLQKLEEDVIQAQQSNAMARSEDWVMSLAANATQASMFLLLQGNLLCLLSQFPVIQVPCPSPRYPQA